MPIESEGTWEIYSTNILIEAELFFPVFARLLNMNWVMLMLIIVCILLK